MALVLAIAAAAGTYYLYTALAFGWSGLGPGPRVHRRAPRRAVRDWLAQAGLSDVRTSEFVGVVGAVGALGAAVGFVLFGGPFPALLVGAFGAAAPVVAYRQRRRGRRRAAQDAWPRMIDEIRLLTGSVGRSVPQALFEVGAKGPAELRPAFDAAQREWLLSTDFGRTVDVLKTQLADPTADATLETLLIAHELGGTDLTKRLEALAEDRRRDVHDRKDARAEQGGARFARRFVLIVPLGMALVGLSVGTGRAAYQTPLGQVTVVIALAMVLGCWVWAGRILRLPDEERVFHPVADR
jgi:tight adherence protein B